jgi:cytochrome c-type biogenesis protein CcmE
MNPLRKQRIYALVSILVGTLIALFFILNALSRNIDLFYTPTQFQESELGSGVLVRLGGMVEEGSLVRKSQSLEVSFVITDFNHSIKINYSGILPNLFSENTGVVVKGSLDEKENFQAVEVLAKHDENYMPPEVSKALKIRK